MHDSWPSDLNQDLLCELSSMNIIEYFENRVKFLFGNFTFIMQFSSKIRMVCSESDHEIHCADCTQNAC